MRLQSLNLNLMTILKKSRITNEQLKLYALGHKELTGQKADYIQIYDIRSNTKKPRQVIEGYHLDETAAKIHHAATEIRQQHFVKVDVKPICKNCFQYQVCSAGIKWDRNG